MSETNETCPKLVSADEAFNHAVMLELGYVPNRLTDQQKGQIRLFAEALAMCGDKGAALQQSIRERDEQLEAQPCGHPKVAIGKVNQDNANEEPHCLWCGDLSDLSYVLDSLGRVYCHITGGRVSKPMTDPYVVIAMADDWCTEAAEAAVKEETEELVEQLEAVRKERDEIQRCYDRDTAKLQQEIQRLTAANFGTYWRWQGDGNDYLESLTCPILMDVGQLKKIFSVNMDAIAHAEAAEREAERLKAACEEFRDCVLNGRHQLESPCLDGDQTNAVLGLFDDTVTALLDQPEKEPTDA